MTAIANAPDQLLNWAGWVFFSILKIAFALLLLRAAYEAAAGGVRGLFRRKRRTRKHR